MLVVGLTGGIATGKSTVSSLLNAQSVPIIDADIIARQVVLPGTRTFCQIAEYFGKDILLPSGALDRSKLGAIIFSNEEKRRKLNAIVHPAVCRAMLWEIAKLWLKGERYCILDVPLLIEVGIYKWVGKVVVVSCCEEIQLARLMARDKSSREAADARIKSQMPIEKKAKYADIVLDNSGSLDELKGQVNVLAQDLERETRWAWIWEWLLPPLGILAAIFTLGSRSLLRRNLQTGEERKDQ